MPKLYLKFALSSHQGFPPPSVVAAADLDRNHRPDDAELFLLTNQGLVWQGALSFEQPTNVEGLRVSLVYLANPGATLHVEVRTDGPDGKVYNKTSLNVRESPEQLFLRLKGPTT